MADAPVIDLPGIGPEIESDAPGKPRPGPDADVDRSMQGEDSEGKERTAQEKKDEEDMLRAVVLRAKARYEYYLSCESDNRTRQLDDTKFAWERGAQWNPDIRERREKAQPPRPWLEFNMTGPYIKRITNEQRQNQPQITVRPAKGGATTKVADIYSGLIRDIQQCSNAASAYDQGIEHAATGGAGYFRVISEYEDEKSFNQTLRIRGIANAMSAMLDPDAIEPDKSDSKWGFIVEWIDLKVFEKEWPDQADLVGSWDGDARTPMFANWWNGDMVALCDYYEKIEVDDELIALSDGRVIWSSELDEELSKGPMGSLPSVIVKREKRKRTRVDWYKLADAELPLDRYDWPGKYIPIVMVPGDEINIDGKKIRQGVIRRIRDAQMMYNYWYTLATERIALAPRAPWVAAEGQFEGHPEWEDANNENYPYLEYVFVKTEDGQWVTQPPNRQEPIPVDSGLITMLQICAQNLRDITGQRDADQQANPNVPWRAILAETRKGDLATYHYGDNLSRAISLGGTILVDLIPHYFDSQRALRILEEDGSDKSVVVNQQVPHPNIPGQTQTQNDLTIGVYDVAVVTGPGYATRRIEAANEMQEFMTALGPQVAPMIGDLFASTTDWPDNLGERIAGRLFAMLPAQIQAADKSDDPQVQALQGAMQQAQQQSQQQLQQLQQQLQQLQQQLGQATQAIQKLQTQLLQEQAKTARAGVAVAASRQQAVAAQNDQGARIAEAHADVATQQMESQDVQIHAALDAQELQHKIDDDKVQRALEFLDRILKMAELQQKQMEPIAPEVAGFEQQSIATPKVNGGQ